MRQVSQRYEKLWEIQEKADKNALKDVSEHAQMDTIYKALLKSYDDPYSMYMTEKETKRFENEMSGHYSGVGASLDSRDGKIYISRVMEKSPAKAAGLKAGDVLISIDGNPCDSIQESMHLLKGNAGSSMKVVIRRKGKRHSMNVIRGEVESDSVTTAILDHKIGYIWISAFQKKTAEQFRNELNQMERKNVKGLILDLRGNGGGYTSEALKTADALLPECTITSMQTKNGKKTYENSDEECTKLNYVVLVDHDTASAAEIVASAIKDNDGGKVIGTRTYGKGVIQRMFKLSDGTAFRLTVMQYFTPGGEQINGKGVTPDITVSNRSTSRDRQLERAQDILEK